MSTHLLSTSDRFVCLQCGNRSFLPDTCPRCGRRLLDETKLPSWAMSGNSQSRTKTTLWGLLLPLITLGAVYPALRAAEAVVGPDSRTSVFALLVDIILFTMAIVASCSLRFLIAAQKRISARLAMRSAKRTIAEKPLSPIRLVQNGASVRIGGIARVIKTAPHPSGSTCVAFESEADGVSQQGGEFEVRDDSGVRAIVKGEYVVIADGVREGDTVVVPDGSSVEVMGQARWIAALDETSGGGLRESARTVEITGTPAEPIVIRWIEDAERARTGIRVPLKDETAQTADHMEREQDIPQRTRTLIDLRGRN